MGFPRDIDYAVENNNIKYASDDTYSSGFWLKKKNVYLRLPWVVVAGRSGCGEWGLPFAAARGPLRAVASSLQSSALGTRASLVAAPGL